jgi:hypothetical protein
MNPPGRWRTRRTRCSDLALFELELGDTPAAFVLYDEAIGGTGSPVVMDLIDACSMLWRLQLRGVDVGTRWSVWRTVGRRPWRRVEGSTADTARTAVPRGGRQHGLSKLKIACEETITML